MTIRIFYVISNVLTFATFAFFTVFAPFVRASMLYGAKWAVTRVIVVIAIYPKLIVTVFALIFSKLHKLPRFLNCNPW